MTTGGPYREHEPVPEARETLRARFARYRRAFVRFVVVSTPAVVFTTALGCVPAVIAHAAGAFSWHWLAVPWLVTGASCAVFFQARNYREATVVVGGAVYVVAIVVLGLSSTSAQSTSFTECRESVARVGLEEQCPHPRHRMNRVDKGDDQYIECRCER